MHRMKIRCRGESATVNEMHGARHDATAARQAASSSANRRCDEPCEIVCIKGKEARARYIHTIALASICIFDQQLFQILMHLFRQAMQHYK